MEQKIKFELGQKVIFDATYYRSIKYDHEFKTPSRTKRFKIWKKHNCTATKGIIVGLRRLANGISEFYYGEGTIFTPKEYVQAVLVATHIRHSILKVPIENIVLDIEV